MESIEVTIKLVEELSDFFECRNRFAVCDDYVGMEASRIPEVFIEYFDSLSDEDQKRMTAIIVAATLGEVANLVDYLDSASSLLLQLCLRRRAQYLGNERDALEREFNKPENIAAWSRTGDAASYDGLDYKREWRYALTLWGVLYLLKSDRIEASYDYLLKHAQSPHFRNALVTARRMYDSGVLDE